MKVLITRPLGDSQKLATYLKSFDIESLIMPMFRIEYVEGSILQSYCNHDDVKADAVIFTSKHAVYSMQKSGMHITSDNCFVVGNAHQDYSKYLKRKFKNISFAEDVASLIEMISNFYNYNIRCDNENLSFLYLRGEIITYDIKSHFEKGLFCENQKNSGFQKYAIEELVVYKTHPAELLSTECVDEIKSENINCVVLFSENTARIFMNLMQKYNLQSYMEDLSILTISNKVEDVVFQYNKNAKTVVFRNQALLPDIITKSF